MSHIAESSELSPPAGQCQRLDADTLKSAKLTASQIKILTEASQREDRLVVFNASVGAARRKTIERLLQLGHLVEVLAQTEQPVWRTDETGRAIGAAMTQAGLAFLSGRAAVIQRQAAPSELPCRAEAADPCLQPAVKVDDPMALVVGKSGSKREVIIRLLRRPEGASICDLRVVTGWLPHTTRAALTGLRHKGFVLDRSSGSDGKAVYRIVASPHKAGTKPPLTGELASQAGEAA